MITGGEKQPALVYLEGQLMREWVSPSASVWRNQSVLSFVFALHQEKPIRKHVIDWAVGSEFSVVVFFLKHISRDNYITHSTDLTLRLTEETLSLAFSTIPRTEV